MSACRRPARGALAAAACGLLTPLAAGPARPAPLPAPAAPAWELRAEQVGSQHLFRVSYDGPEGRGGLRITLRLAAPERFYLSAADQFGRAQWSLDFEAGRVRVLDHRRQVACEYGEQVALPEIALSPLPAAALPRLLLGRLPAAPEPPAPPAGASWDFRDADGRRWTATVEPDGAVARWTLWQEAEPVLWWRRQDLGGMLSHRAGVQYRWRRSVSEPLREALPAFAVPPGYTFGDCDATRLP